MKHLTPSTFMRYLSTLFLIAIFSVQIALPSIIMRVDAAYVETDSDSFVGYKRKIESALQDMEREFRVNNSISDGMISNLRGLTQEAYIRLPDSGDAAGKNESLKKSVDLYLDLAAKNKASSTHAQNAASQIARFLSEAQISQITGSITANPQTGNAPLTSSFLATAKDPSGINIPDSNYIWWMREAGGYRRELGRGPSLTYTFSKEGNYQVFLDVISESRNKKGKTDVTPLTISQDISVAPRLGNVILLINGVNVSNIDTLKVNPTLGKIGLLFDATASRAVSNGVIAKTKWDFGNGNTLEYDGAPILEKQLYVNPEMYKVILEITTNQGQTFKKQIQLLIRDPAAVITLDKESGFIDEDIKMSAKSYLINATNVEYTWEIQDINDNKKVITSKAGSVFSHKFKKVGQYLITLTTRNPNGSTDSDSRIIVIEARPPIVNLDAPKPISPEKPNTILFDASRSLDADTNTNKGLKYEWSIDGEKVQLDNSTKDGAIGTYTFKEKGAHSVSLTVANENGKVTTVNKNFEVTSTLTVGLNISPRATQIGTKVGFQARSPDARFYEWNLGDGSPSINGTADFVSNTYKKTGVYTVSLTVRNADGSEQNTITRKVYITDTDKPFGLIDVKNTDNTVIDDPTACENADGAFIINRASATTIDGGNSINIDGNPNGLDYTWTYMGKQKTGPSFSEKWSELGCNPIELTVRSQRNGTTHTTKRYVQIKNITPKVTSVDASIDTTKKDTQKLIVNVTANGARDDDGVITSYIWFYTTESDSEKQNIRITQSPSTTFVLPNVTEKYYFNVIAEDNDGARYDTSENITEQKPLLISNDDANINMPLINLTLSKSQALVDESVTFSVKAKNILGNDITNKSEYFWDFDGDGKIDQKTNEPTINYIYKKSGKYNMKVKVTYNGVSNTKYQIVYVKNELKASVTGYRIGNMVYFLNTSKGAYNSAKWDIAGVEGTSLYSMNLKNALISTGAIGTLTVSASPTESSTVDIRDADIRDITPAGTGGVSLQSYPEIINNTITLSSPGEKIILSMYGNTAKEYRIDTDTKIDSDIDTISDNDIDNKDDTSFTDGSVYVIDNVSTAKTRTRTMKVSLLNHNNQVFATQDITVVFDFIPENNNTELTTVGGSGSTLFSENDKKNLESLQTIIRSLDPEDRIIFTQHYNTLIENWSDLYDRTEGLLLIQKEVNTSTTLDEATKMQISDIIDLTLVGDAQAVNDVSIASHVIEGLIPSENPNRTTILEKLEKIKSNPGNLTDNKNLGKEILEIIQSDASISTENKLLIKSQLLTIINGGQENVPTEEANSLSGTSDKSAGVMGFITGTVQIFLIIIAIIAVLFFIGFIAYRFSRKNNDMGFQDFLIDSIAHTKKEEPKANITPPVVPKNIETSTIPDPVSHIESTSPSDPLASIPTPSIEQNRDADPLGQESTNSDTPSTPPKETTTTEDVSIPNWLKATTNGAESADIVDTRAEVDTIPQTRVDTPTSDVLMASDSAIVPDWLKPPAIPTPNKSRIQDDSDAILMNPKNTEAPIAVSSTPDDISITPETPEPNIVVQSGEESSTEIVGTDSLPTDTLTAPVIENEIIPDWLVATSSNPTPAADSIGSPTEPIEETITPQQESSIEPVSNDLPDWLKNSFDTTNDAEEDINETPATTESINTPLLEIGEEEVSTPKKKSVTKKKTTPKSKTKSENTASAPSDIPDWLK